MSLAPGYRQSPVSTVHGVALEPDERVVWIRTHSHTAEKVRLIIGGILFLPLLVGIFLLLKAASIDKKWPRAHVLTTRRLLVVRAAGMPHDEHALGDVVDVEPVRMNVRGGGVVGAIAGAAVGSIANHLASRSPKLDPAYWARAAHVLVAKRSGERVQVPKELNYSEALWCQELGPLLARAIFARDIDRFPSVPHPS